MGRRAEDTHRRRPGRHQLDPGRQGSATYRVRRTITFRSATRNPESFEITGELSTKDRTHPVTAHAKGNGDALVRSWATVTQSTWRIKPYTAFLGALRLADDVRIEFHVARLQSAHGTRQPHRPGRMPRGRSCGADGHG
ncbi:YceI family protein [Streptomyces sp. NPDC048419]|uniref:YceI family protein n=1 Tax=Streptomyces sp. NPDC048419 TaxID=3365547 RepID=UPI0037172506